MGKQQKSKSATANGNDARPNGKAAKKRAGRGRETANLTELQKVLLGGGLYTKWNKLSSAKPTGIPRRIKDSDD